MKKALFGGGKGAAVGAPSSSSSPPPASFPETVNVGGVSLSITSLRPFLAENPTTALSILLLRKITANPQELPFLDHNPFAFTVILDYFRYGRIYIPRNVAKAVVLLQMREFGIPFAAADVVDGESVM